jgi:hypothetical protein
VKWLRPSIYRSIQYKSEYHVPVSNPLQEKRYIRLTPLTASAKPLWGGPRRVEINQNMPYISGMNDFIRGMNSIGQLFPAPIPYSNYPRYDSAWRGVANSFYQTGNNLRAAMKEFSDARQKSKPTP